jgi:hypothetical protein
LNTVLGWAGKLLPILGTIPGLGVVALAAKVVTAFNAVRGFAQSVKNGNWLGMAGSLAGAVAGFSQGAFQAFASKVANIANVGQQVMTTLKHGLGNGLLQVVSNGANLVSGIAQAAADLGQGAFRSEANNLAQATGTVAGYAGGVDSALKGDLQPIVTQVAGDVVRNNPPQVKNPVANPPPVASPFQGTPPKGTEYSVSPQPSPFTPTVPPSTVPPSIVKGPKDPIVKDPLDSIVKGPKDPIVKDPLDSIVKGPKDPLDSIVKDPKNPKDLFPDVDDKGSVVVAGPGVPVSSPQPQQRTQAQNLMELLKDQMQFNPANVWGLLTDMANNSVNVLNNAPILLGASAALPIGELFPNALTNVLGLSADVALRDMGAQVIGQSFLWAPRPWSNEGEVRATPVELTVAQMRTNLAYAGPVVSDGKFPTIAGMYDVAKSTGTAQTSNFVSRNPLLGSFKIIVTVTPDGRMAAKIEDGWRWSTTTTDGMGNYNWHGGGIARNAATVSGEIFTLGKRIVVPVTSETATEKLLPGENRSNIEILRSFGPQLNPIQRGIRDFTGGRI